MNEREKKYMRKVLKLLFFTSRGGRTRLQIVKLLSNTPMNANQISEKLRMDYKTVVHHLEVLMQNDLVIRDPEKYGATYRLTYKFKLYKEILDELEKEEC